MEAGVEEKLQRGHLLREILKQDRLQPLSATAHLAWLLAYGEGLLADVRPENAAAVLEKLWSKLPDSGLHPDLPKPQWLAILQRLLAEPA